MLIELKSCFLEAYDDNQDGKIDIRELAQLLPMGNTLIFLSLFDSHHIATWMQRLIKIHQEEF